MKTWLAWLSAVTFSFVMLLVTLPAHGDTSIKVSCSFSHTLKDDPIVFPNQPGASHRHDFFGNDSTDAYSTTASMEGQTTSCASDNPGDTAGYWTPSLKVNKTVTHDVGFSAYYYRRNEGMLTPYPQGFQMVAGNSHATGAQSRSVVYYGCGNGTSQPVVNYMPDCTADGTHLYIHILFPWCWDGVFTGGNDTAHVAYGPCDAAHPYHFPQLVERINWDAVVNATHGVKFTSGAWYSVHADYLSVWADGALEDLIASL
jgi:hypothetical protein